MTSDHVAAGLRRVLTVALAAVEVPAGVPPIGRGAGRHIEGEKRQVHAAVSQCDGAYGPASATTESDQIACSLR